MGKLNAKRVNEIVIDCLFRDNELGDTSKAVLAPCIIHTFGFHPERLEQHKQEIIELLEELPATFKTQGEGHGGGMSFLNACVDKHDEFWGEHKDMEALFGLGIAVGYARFVMPPQFWSAFPGGMPYIAVGPELPKISVGPETNENSPSVSGGSPTSQGPAGAGCSTSVPAVSVTHPDLPANAGQA